MGQCLSEAQNSRAISANNGHNSAYQHTNSTKTASPLKAQLTPPSLKVILRPLFPKELPQPMNNLSLQGQIKPIAN